MSRVKLELPETPLFVTDIDVRITDINYGGHLGNDSLLSLLHEARVRFLKHLGWSESSIGGVGILMSDAVLVYKAEIRYGEILRIEVGVADVHACGADITYRVTSQGTEAARAKTGIVFFDHSARKVARTPAEFRVLAGSPPP